MFPRESNRRQLLFVALALMVFLSLFLLQKQHDLVLQSKSPGFITEAGTKHIKEKSEDTPSPNAPLQTKLPDASLAALQNETLGFEKVYVINLPKRTDKLDAIRLSASVTGFNFEVIKAVNGKDMSPKALPGARFTISSIMQPADRLTAREETPLSAAGGRTCNLRISRLPSPSRLSPIHRLPLSPSIVDNRLSSALAFEDDADWDTSFRAQLLNYALGSQWLLRTPADTVPHSPYGNDWDLLWLGHCASQPVPGDQRRVIFENDPGTTPVKYRFNLGGTPDMSHYANTTRIMYAAEGGTCLYAYALSYRGAQKVLFHLSMSYYHRPVDFGIHEMCHDQSRNFRCIGVFPQMVDSHRGAGNSSKDSDISKGQEQDRKKGFSYNIVHSTRLNAARMIDGATDQEMESQWPGEVPEMDEDVKISFREKFTEN
ncbi:MAG: hypothetical protein LQ342_008267 [Letrouitia transgressa]|nr:MAG: hypothetical protein LQ342_008267 [Letrouitia transgressa]